MRDTHHKKACAYSGQPFEEHPPGVGELCICNPLLEPDVLVDLLMAEPSNGSVIKLGLAFPGSPITYTYSGIRVKTNWYLSNMDTPMTWPQLFRWVQVKKATIVSLQLATTWETL